MNFTTNISSDYSKLSNIPEANKKALIDYSASDFDTIKARLIEYIKAVYPTDYTYFSESDLGIVILELVAYVGAVNSLKADMLANENYLQTATRRDSVSNLLNLVGIRMRGPLSSVAEAFLTFDSSSTSYTIAADNRSFTATSPEDGSLVSFTLYKVVNGRADTYNTGASLVLNDIEADQTLDAEDPRIFSNLVLQEGSLVQETGEFTNTEEIKRIKLSNFPVIEGSVEVYIESQDSNVEGVYTQVDNIYFASGSSDKIFEVNYDSSYKATLVFGDGIVGTSPGVSDTFSVAYRIGGGTRGNLLPGGITGSLEATSAESTTIPGTITNSTPATGGANAESVESARRWGPLTFARQDRVVSLEDFVSFANYFVSTVGTTGKATAATRKGYASANVIDLYVLERASDLQLQKATPNYKINLLEAINLKKMLTDEVVISDGLIRTLDLAVTITLSNKTEPQEPTVVSKVRDKITTFFNSDNIEFGERLGLSDLIREIFEVVEVRYASIDNLDKDVVVEFNQIIQLNNLTINAVYIK